MCSFSVCDVYGGVPWPDCFDSGGAFPKEITGLGAVCMAFLLIENAVKFKGLKQDGCGENSPVNSGRASSQLRFRFVPCRDLKRQGGRTGIVPKLTDDNGDRNVMKMSGSARTGDESENCPAL